MQNKEITILLIEDEIGFQVIIKKLLSGNNIYNTIFNLEKAEKIENIEKTISNKKIDIILLDLNLPSSYGIDTYYEVSKILNDVPIIIITNVQDEDLIFECLQQGVQDYIMKNELNKSTLQKAIIHSIERYELQRNSKKLTEQLDSFAHTIAHNLRHPLQTILTISETIKELYKEDKNLDPTPYLDEIERKLFNLSDMVNNLLYYSSSTSIVKEKFEIVSLSDCVKKALDNLKGMANCQNVSIKYENLPSVYGDKSLITVLFQNLIENSIKYRSVHPPSIEIEADKTEDDDWEISIVDNGIGISENDMNLLFDAFKRPNRTKNYDGFGIGLATCKRIIELHNGKIWVEPKREKGAAIHFIIPDTENNS